MSLDTAESRSRDPEELRLAAKARGRQLVRRRHMAVMAMVVVVAVAGVGVSLALVAYGPRSAPISMGGSPKTEYSGAASSVALPSSDLFSQIIVADGHLLLSGEVAATASAKTPACVSATVDARTLDLRPTVKADCNNPAYYGEKVGVVNRYLPNSNNATLSIARNGPSTGKTSIGPVIMTYRSYSDTRPVMAYGGGWLWIYDNSTIVSGGENMNTSQPGTAELLQVSTSTGQVVDTVPVPVLYRPLVAANDDGLWIGNSVEGGECSGCLPPSALYYVAPGADKVVVAIPDSTAVVCWLLGSGDHVWAGMGHEQSGCTQETISRIDGTDFQPIFTVPDQGYDPNYVVGDEADGLWTMQWAHPPTGATPTLSRQEIVGINPDTGAERVVTDLPALIVPLSGEYSGLVQGQATVLDGSLYLLEPPFAQSERDLGYRTLRRVRLP